MAKKFFTIKCPHCLASLKTNNVLFREKNTNGDYDYFDPAVCEITRNEKDKRRIDGIKKNNGDPINERCCPYCKGKLPESFGTYDIKYYIALIDSQGRKKNDSQNVEKNDYIESIVRNLLSSGWENLSDDIGVPILKNETGKKEIHAVIYQPFDDSFSKSNKEKEIERLKNTDGFIIIIDSLKFFNNLLDIFKGKQNEVSKIPIAFVFNKVDETFKDKKWDEIPETIQNKGIITKSMRNGIDKNDIIERHEEIIQRFLEDPSDHDLLNQKAELNQEAKKVFGEKSLYFALTSGSKKGTETPFLWLLSELGAFPVIKQRR